MIRRFLVEVDYIEQQFSSDSAATTVDFEVGVRQIEEHSEADDCFTDDLLLSTSKKETLGEAFQEAVMQEIFRNG